MGLRLFVFIAALLTSVASEAVVTLSVDSAQRHQSWEGWEATVEQFHIDVPFPGDQHPVPQNILNGLIDDAVNNLGLTALRLEVHPVHRGGGMEESNDNKDPFVLDSGKIRWANLDAYVRCIAIPFKQRVEARGEKFTLNLHAVAWGVWHWHSPTSDPGQEYAEFMMACLDRLKDRHRIVPDYLTIYNEPNNGSEGRDVVIRAMKKLTARMQAAGYATKLRFPDTSTASAALSWFDRLVATEPGLMRQVGHLSFHGYGGFNPSTLNAIRSRAEEHGIATSQTEWWFTSNHPPDIFSSMTEADVTLYQPYALGAWPNNNPSRGLYACTYLGGDFPLHSYTGWRRGPDWYEIYQFSAFIRPGDVRIEITTSNDSINPVAFRKPEGEIVVVAINSTSAGQDVQIEGLPTGTYGIVYTAPGDEGKGIPPISLEKGQSLAFQIPGNAIAAFHPISKSTFKVEEMSYTPDGAKLEWGVVPGATYQVHFSSALETWSPLTKVLRPPQGAGSLSVVDRDSHALPRGFYKVGLLP